MKYQVRHKTFGIFQGSREKNMYLYWYPLSCIPGKGLYAFENKKNAQKFIDFHCKNNKWMKGKNYWVIEVFDVELDSDLRKKT